MKLTCQTCPRHCVLQPGESGRCGVRKNENGTVICGSYGQITSMALDPVEKKPLKMFYPGSLVLSVGSYGCNMNCPFCQNHEISMKKTKAPAGSRYVSPGQLVQKALDYKSAGNIGVAYTYNEPLTGWEYVLDAAKLVRAAGMKNIIVTNGMASEEVLERILPYTDAMNIDLKGFTNVWYQKLGGDLKRVKEFILRAAAVCHVELTTLIVPGENDDPEKMREQAGWITSVSKTIPLHVTRFFPRYHMTDRPATEIQTVYKLADIAGRYLEHVFVGNC